VELGAASLVLSVTSDEDDEADGSFKIFVFSLPFLSARLDWGNVDEPEFGVTVD